MKRVVTDQAGMAYGMSGDLQKARSIFEKAIAEDPVYPLYYYRIIKRNFRMRRMNFSPGSMSQVYASCP